MKTKKLLTYGVTLVAVAGIYSVAVSKPQLPRFEIVGTQGTALDANQIAAFDEPWAMTFLPDGSMLVTQKAGKLLLVSPDGEKAEVRNVMPVAYAGQGGLGDVIIHPDFERNRWVYLSYAQEDPETGDKGALVIRATLETEGAEPKLGSITPIWTQDKTSGAGHYSHKMAFGPNGYLFITSGERQKQTPSQDMTTNLGKIIRVRDDGSVPPDNPYQNDGDLAKSFWTVGHRNMLGIAFAPDGTLWVDEMGPRHGDEFNRIEAGTNYGWPIVSNGNNYSGIPIPDHDTRPEFNAPEAFWVPSIAPAGMIIYNGDLFADWQGDALIGALAGEALVHVNINGTSAQEAERFEWGSRVREVEEAPDGSIYVLEDGDGGRMLKLTPME